MSDKHSSSKPSKSSHRSSSPHPTIDVRSELFDPLKALYSQTIVVPVENARIYDNIGKYESVVNQTRKPAAQSSAKLSKFDGKPIPMEPKPSSNSSTSTADNPFKRQFLPHQMMVPGTGNTKHKRNLLLKYEDNWFDGPLARLQKCMKERQRVKIYTRNTSGLLGHITGIVESFDKHWNMALSDVFEVWKRRKAYLCDTAACDNDATDDCTNRLRNLGINLPVVQVKSLNRRQVECSRRLSQAMIRGEQVALVVFMDEKQDKSTVVAITDM